MLAHVGETPAGLAASLRSMRELWSSVVALVKDDGFGYEPLFDLV